ncbi:MAG: hypothetical protein QOJ13_3453 [Gaiellales bacterium]|jgi:hypothetical protein|nr:hypothetical protein [Gaiellales bacterium]
MSERAYLRFPGRRATLVALMVTTFLVVAANAEAKTLKELNTRPAAAAKAVVAAPVPLEAGTWTVFDVGGTGSVSVVYTFRSTTPVLLRVTDAYCRGDEFTVYDRGLPIFDTSTVGTDPSCDDKPNLSRGPGAWADQSYSKGKFLLEPGRHRVKMKITDSPFGAASAFLRVDPKP